MPPKSPSSSVCPAPDVSCSTFCMPALPLPPLPLPLPLPALAFASLVSLVSLESLSLSLRAVPGTVP
eukprot:440898-Alexandrium_andersonii.AAC.1